MRTWQTAAGRGGGRVAPGPAAAPSCARCSGQSPGHRSSSSPPPHLLRNVPLPSASPVLEWLPPGDLPPKSSCFHQSRRQTALLGVSVHQHTRTHTSTHTHTHTQVAPHQPPLRTPSVIARKGQNIRDTDSWPPGPAPCGRGLLGLPEASAEANLTNTSHPRPLHGHSAVCRPWHLRGEPSSSTGPGSTPAQQLPGPFSPR